MNDSSSRCCCCNTYIEEIICRILELQGEDLDSELGCDRPFLGPNASNNAYNTRPIQLYNRYTAEPWSFDYSSGDTSGTSNIFRIENIEQCCVTVRLLAGDGSSGFTNTNQFATIDLCSIGAIRCFNDVFVTL